MTEIIAHRGASRECHENTLAAFARALEQGADGIELDVHATSDGMVVVHHDPVVPILAAGERQSIRGLTMAELSTVRLADGSAIPTLAEVFDLVGSAAAIYIEVKAHGIEDALLACLDRQTEARFAVHAFDHRIPAAVRAARPGTRIGFLSASYPLDLRATLGAPPPDALWQAGDLIDAQLVRDAHAKGARVIAWTVNSPAHARTLVGHGVDALCTDTPGLLRAGLSG